MPTALRPVLLSSLVFIAFHSALLRAQDQKPTPKTPTTTEATEQDPAPDVITRPRHIVLIAGPKDPHHGEGTHEYAETVKRLAAALKASNVAQSAKVTTVYDGWPDDPKILDQADTIFLASAGADRDETEHPFLAPERMAILRKQMDRGCGLVLYHWSLFVPVKYESEFIDWVGGFFDYERGSGENKWASAINFGTTLIEPETKHPISKGVQPFEHHDEFYHHIHFAENDARLQPVVTIELDEVKEPQVVGWGVERNNGGRGFGFTGGHYQESWENDDYRTLLLNAICWTAHVPLPPSGVHKELSFDDQWTPKPHLGKEDLPKESEDDWYDDRIRRSNIGPYFTASMVVPPLGDAPTGPEDTRKTGVGDNMVVKALAIRLWDQNGDPSGGVLFDKESMMFRCGWDGPFLNHSDRRFGLLEMPTLGGPTTWQVNKEARWQTPDDEASDKPNPTEVAYTGLYLNGNRVILSYDVNGRAFLDSPTLHTTESNTLLLREIQAAPSEVALTLPLVDWHRGEWSPSDHAILLGEDALYVNAFSAEGDVDVTVADSGKGLELNLPASQQPQDLTLVLWRGPKTELRMIQTTAESLPASTALHTFRDTPQPRWGEPLKTTGQLGQPDDDAPFAVDTITIPYDNRYNALFFVGGFDFTADGTCYVATAHGDVWKVTGVDDDLDQITWQRFATGLYEPLGLKVRDDEVFVLGRDQISRLHDTNGDGEADFYECFNDDLTDSGQSHAYAMCLETDPEGNFYFLKSGAPETPHGGSLIAVSADGQTMTTFATGFRHPNGLGISPEGTITAADNEGNWVPVTRVDIVEQGAFCGHIPTAHIEPLPDNPGQPVCWLPRVVDNSAGGQAFVPEGAWGPLSGSLLHLSFGQCTASLIVKEHVNGVWQGGAVRLPTERFLSGVCRGRFRTEDAQADGHLYVAGLNGWSSEAEADGSLQRVRYLDRPLTMLTELHVHANGVELAFPERVDAKLAANPARYAANIWTYRWTKDYGSKDYSIADPTKEGRDKLNVTAAHVSEDGKRIFLSIPGLQPAMQLRIQAGLETAEGQPLAVDYYGTIHNLASPVEISQETASVKK